MPTQSLRNTIVHINNAMALCADGKLRQVTYTSNTTLTIKDDITGNTIVYRTAFVMGKGWLTTHGYITFDNMRNYYFVEGIPPKQIGR